MKDKISIKFYEKYLKHKNNRLPDIIISGVKKCGTKGKIYFIQTSNSYKIYMNLRFIFKALLAFLLEHPNITGGRRNRFVAIICCYRLQYYSNFNLGWTFYVTVKENIIGILLETFHLTWVAFLDIFMTKNRLNQAIFYWQKLAFLWNWWIR